MHCARLFQTFCAKKFDETHYVAPVVLLESFYWDTVSSDDCGLRDYIREICTKLDFEKDYAIVYKIFEEKGKKIIEDCPGIRECVTETGNCGGVANFLFEGNTSTDEDDFNKLMQELREEVPEDKVKLIKIQANIGHVFTLICYKQGDKTVVELIQAWQGKYSVKKSLNDAGVKNIYSNSELADIFDAMHTDMTNETGRRFYDQVFLEADLKQGINKFEITHLDVKTLNERPGQYAERIASKELQS